jgi:hypothetical protein
MNETDGVSDAIDDVCEHIVEFSVSSAMMLFDTSVAKSNLSGSGLQKGGR